MSAAKPTNSFQKFINPDKNRKLLFRSHKYFFLSPFNSLLIPISGVWSCYLCLGNAWNNRKRAFCGIIQTAQLKWSPAAFLLSCSPLYVTQLLFIIYYYYFFSLQKDVKLKALLILLYDASLSNNSVCATVTYGFFLVGPDGSAKKSIFSSSANSSQQLYEKYVKITRSI